MLAGLQAETGDGQPEHISQVAAQPSLAGASRADTGSAAADESTPARRDSIKRDLSRTIAGTCSLCSYLPPSFQLLRRLYHCLVGCSIHSDCAWTMSTCSCCMPNKLPLSKPELHCSTVKSALSPIKWANVGVGWGFSWSLLTSAVAATCCSVVLNHCNMLVCQALRLPTNTQGVACTCLPWLRGTSEECRCFMLHPGMVDPLVAKCMTAGGPVVSADNTGTPEEPLHRPAFGSSSHMPHTAASTSRPFGYLIPHAAFGSPFPHQPEGSVMGSAMGSPPRHAPFGSPHQAPAFGSISPPNSFANEAFFTPAATLNPRGQHAAPGSTNAVGDAAFDTPGTVYATPGSRFGTPSSGFGSPAFQTPAGQLGRHRSGMRGPGLQQVGTPASVLHFGTPAAGTATPGLTVVRPSSGAAQAGTPVDGAGQEDGVAGGPFGAPAFGGKA